MSGQTPADGGETRPVAAPASTGDGARRVAVTVGNHLGDRRPMALTMSENLVRTTASIVHLARYSTGTCDFALDADGADGPSGPGAPTTDERQIIGRDVVHVMTGLDAYLRPACSGDLIRMVLHTERGALVTLAVLREQFLVGFTGSAGDASALPPLDPAVRTADMALSGLANELRESVSQQPTDYGGWLGLRAPNPESDPREVPPAASASTGTDPAVPVPTGTDPAASAPTGTGPPVPVPTDAGPAVPDDEPGPPASAAETCRRYLDVADLHYAAVCRAGRIEASADLFDDSRLDRFFDDITPQRRRNFYALVGQRVDVHLRNLVRAAHLALGSRVRRLVLDVEQGALYCYPVGLDRYLLGVTLDQHRVWAADDKTALLARRLGG